MVIDACNCSWDIPGIDSLPSHTHTGVMQKIRGRSGHVFSAPKGMIVFSDIHELVEEIEDQVRIWVDWKKAYRP